MTTKTDDEALAWMRDVCLALFDASEGTHHGEVVFKKGSKMFASCGDKRGERTIVIKVAPELTRELLAADFERYPYEKSAIMIRTSLVRDWEQMRSLVEESYALNTIDAPKKAPAKKAKAATAKKKAPAKKAVKKAAKKARAKKAPAKKATTKKAKKNPRRA